MIARDVCNYPGSKKCRGRVPRAGKTVDDRKERRAGVAVAKPVGGEIGKKQQCRRGDRVGRKCSRDCAKRSHGTSVLPHRQESAGSLVTRRRRERRRRRHFRELRGSISIPAEPREHETVGEMILSIAKPRAECSRVPGHRPSRRTGLVGGTGECQLLGRRRLRKELVEKSDAIA